MATNAMTVSVLIRVGDSRPSEVGTFELPLRVQPVSPDDNFGYLILQPDLVVLHEGLRHALREAADSIPEPPTDALAVEVSND